MSSTNARTIADPPGQAWVDRRRHVRVKVPPGMQGTLLPQGLDLTVRDISLGGVSVCAGNSLALNSVHRISLRFGGDRVRCLARTTYCRRSGRSWVIGFAFLQDSFSTGASIATLLKAVLGDHRSS